MLTSTVMALWLCSSLVGLYVLCKAYAEGVCDADITVPRYLDKVCVGNSFNLSCQFLCLSPSHRKQLLHNNQLLLDENFTSPNSTLTYTVSAASSEHSGTYHCKTEPGDAISPNFFIYINDTCKDESEVQTDDNSQSYLLVVWYLLCKAGAFLLFIMFALLPNCHIR